MCESFSKVFEKTTEVLPFTSYGLSSIQEFKEAEKDIQQLELLRKAGLTLDEINLIKENEAGVLGNRTKIEANAKKDKLNAVYSKINEMKRGVERSDDEASSSKSLFNKMETTALITYPEGHPMNNIKEIEQNLFSHHNNDVIIPITKRRKALRRLERKKYRQLALGNQIDIGTDKSVSKVDRPGSLWDMKEMPHKLPIKTLNKKSFIGPKKPTMYTVRDNKIVRLEPVTNVSNEQYKAVDIITPENDAEVQFLEGTKMSIDDIKKIERFKDYAPGYPSKTLYIKNIAASVSQEQLSLLFTQFTAANGGLVDVRRMSGRMRGQAFVTFYNEEAAIQALEETNGTILSGRPIIVQFGRNNNTVDDNR